MLSDRAFCLCNFWWIVQALVLRVRGLLLKFGELSMFWNIIFQSHPLFYTPITHRRDIARVTQFLQIDLPRFRITELGSKSAILLKNNMHNFHKCQKEYVPAFYKIIWQSIMYPFLCPLIYISTILILRLDLRDGPGAGHRVAQIYIYNYTPTVCCPIFTEWIGIESVDDKIRRINIVIKMGFCYTDYIIYTQTKVKQHHIFSETLFWKL